MLSSVSSVFIKLQSFLSAPIPHIQSQINTLGVTAVASFTVYFRVELIVYLPIIALGQAVVSFVGQNYGAGNWNRIKKGNKFSILGGSVSFVNAFKITGITIISNMQAEK